MVSLALPTSGIRLSLGEFDPAINASFDNLPPDNHLESRFMFRRRRYSLCRYFAGELKWLPPIPFLQAAEHNPLAAGRPRPFHSLRSATRQAVASKIIPTLTAQLPSDEFTVGVHQIRIVANDEYMGKPAPEGIHRDGFDFVAVIAVARSNVNGGVTILVDRDNYNDVLFEDTLERGAAILFDDRNVAHYTTPITPRYPGAASRDVFVLTFSMAQQDLGVQERVSSHATS